MSEYGFLACLSDPGLEMISDLVDLITSFPDHVLW